MVDFIDFNQASNYILSFGPYKGQTLNMIGATHKGLIYLDNIFCTGDSKNVAFPYIKAYLKDKGVINKLLLAHEILDEKQDQDNITELYVG